MTTSNMDPAQAPDPIRQFARQYTVDDLELPISHEIKFNPHSNAITSISLDPPAARMATGSYDGSVQLYDFNSMDSLNLTPFREIESETRTQVHCTQFSPSGNSLLVLSRDKAPKIYDRDGHELAQYATGDMYLVDLHNVKGHVAEITAGDWCSTELFVTASADSTVRLWDPSRTRASKSVFVIRDSGVKGRTRVTAVKHGHNRIYAAGQSGSLYYYAVDGPTNRPAGSVSAAHSNPISSIALHDQDPNTVVTRANGEARVWDTRNLKVPVLQRADFALVEDAIAEHMAISYSPDHQYLISGGLTRLHIMDKDDLSNLETVPMAAVSSVWSPKLNQIIAGDTQGSLSIFFDPDLSEKGGLDIAKKIPRRRQDQDYGASISSAGLDIRSGIQEQRQGKSKAPGLWGTPDADHARSLGGDVDQDPREQLLKYAKRKRET